MNFDLGKYQNYVWLLVVTLLVVYIFKYLDARYKGVHTAPLDVSNTPEVVIPPREPGRLGNDEGFDGEEKMHPPKEPGNDVSDIVLNMNSNFVEMVGRQEAFDGCSDPVPPREPGNDHPLRTCSHTEGFESADDPYGSYPFNGGATPDGVYWQRTYEPENQFDRWTGKIITNEKEKVKCYKDKRPFHYPETIPPLSHLGKLQYLPNRRRVPTREATHNMLKSMNAPPYIVSRTLQKLNMENDPDDYMLKSQWLPENMKTDEFDASHQFQPK